MRGLTARQPHGESRGQDARMRASAESRRGRRTHTPRIFWHVSYFASASSNMPLAVTTPHGAGDETFVIPRERLL